MYQPITFDGTKTFFVLGMRRSGTSFLRQLIMENPDIKNVLFEPHELIFAAQSIDIKRYRKSEYHFNALQQLESKDLWMGAKIVGNPGIEFFNWKWLAMKFPEAKFVFIRRDVNSTYNSWIKNETSPRGTISLPMYHDWWRETYNAFYLFMAANPDRCCHIEYEDLLKDVNKELTEVEELLKIQPFRNLQHMVEKPNN